MNFDFKGWLSVQNMPSVIAIPWDGWRKIGLTNREIVI
jgi:hypothetical protein